MRKNSTASSLTSTVLQSWTPDVADKDVIHGVRRAYSARYQKLIPSAMHVCLAAVDIVSLSSSNAYQIGILAWHIFSVALAKSISFSFHKVGIFAQVFRRFTSSIRLKYYACMAYSKAFLSELNF